MLCSSCHGQHFVVRGNQLMPCPECGGLGEIHCCDGLNAQADSPMLSPSLPDSTDGDAHSCSCKVAR